jgi:nicotinamide-nucleotide adenylyltransferase
VEAFTTETTMSARPLSEEVDRGLFIGRFQPFHLGHLEAVRKLAQQHDELILGIGSANVSHTATNPFTAGERLEMIRGALKDAQVTHVVPIPIPDVGRNAVWVSHVKSLVPRFRVAHTNNPLPARLFREAGHQVAPVPFFERAKFEATSIRADIAKGGDHWRTLVPGAVAKLIADVDGPRRIAELLHSDGRVEGSDASP